MLPPRRRRTAVIASAVLVVGTLAWLDHSGAARGPRADYHRYHGRSATVVQVIDGDTVEVDIPDGSRPRTRIRLWGIDAPELGGADQPAMHFAFESVEFARRELQGTTVRIVLVKDRTRDKFDRILAYLHVASNADSFNIRLVAEGLAYADPRFEHPHSARFALFEQRARRAGPGLWGAITQAEMPDWRQNPAIRPERREVTGPGRPEPPASAALPPTKP